MINAQKEFLKSIEWKSRIKELYIAYWYNLEDFWWNLIDETINYWWEKEDMAKVYELKEWYTEQEYNNIIESLNFMYDDWYWGQNLFWYVIFEDWTRLERYEYDWAERRVYKKIPNIEEYRIK